MKGNHHTSTEEIEHLTGFCIGDNLLRMPVDCASKVLCELPWVKEVTIRRVYPHRVEITVGERTPIAVVPAPAGEKGLLVIGEGGVIVQQVSDEIPMMLSVSGVDFTGDAPGARLVDKRVTATLERLHRKGMSGGSFSLVDFSDPSSVTLYGKDGLKVTLGSVDGIGSKIDALAALLLTIDPEDYQSIDLRFGGEAVLVPR